MSLSFCLCCWSSTHPLETVLLGLVWGLGSRCLLLCTQVFLHCVTGYTRGPLSTGRGRQFQNKWFGTLRLRPAANDASCTRCQLSSHLTFHNQSRHVHSIGLRGWSYVCSTPAILAIGVRPNFATILRIIAKPMTSSTLDCIKPAPHMDESTRCEAS